jgi:radical SAM superfamily enzyme YgiQ (UPF0313 family)
LAIWRFIRDNDNGVTNFHFEIAADLVDEDMLEVMSGMRAGLIQLEIGVQSTNPRTLEAINRKMDLEHVRGVVDRIHRFGTIHQHLDLIAGLPYEDYESFGRSFDDVYEMEPNQLQLGFLKVLKGSPMEEAACEFGILYGSKPPYEVLSTRWLSYSDVLKLKGVEEMVEIYYNSNQFSHTIGVLVREFESPFKMFEALADYYREGGYFINTPSRIYRYEVLLGFACSISKRTDCRELYGELLVFDLYLRENLKSRPAFSPESGVSRDIARVALEGKDRHLAHVERFFYPVWSEVAKGRVEKLDAEQYVLFDYGERDVLSHDAAVSVVKLR